MGGSDRALRKNQARVSRRLSLGSQEESGEDSRGVPHMQSGRTRTWSPVDPANGFKEEPWA